MSGGEPTTRVALEVHICDQRRSYIARFASGDLAVAFMDRRAGDHAFSEIEDEPIAPVWGPVTEDVLRLLSRLYPLCEHQMDASMCCGPDHFPSAAQERAWGW
jgi:hypothetical protein